MVWVKLDDGFPDHPKVVKAGPLAAWLFVCGLGYCNRQLTDGLIPAEQVMRLLPVPNIAALTKALVAVRLWEEADGNYLVHDYLDYNPSRAQVQATQAVRAEAGRTGGKRSGEVRRSKPEAKAKQNGFVDASYIVEAKTNPVPVPVPITSSSYETSTETQPPSSHMHGGSGGESGALSAPNGALARAQAFAMVPAGRPKAVPHAALYTALAAALGCDEPATRSEKAKWMPPVCEMLRAPIPVTPEEVPRLVAAFKATNGVPCTPQGIANQLSQLRRPMALVRSNGHTSQRESPLEQARRMALEERQSG